MKSGTSGNFQKSSRSISQHVPESLALSDSLKDIAEAGATGGGEGFATTGKCCVIVEFLAGGRRDLVQAEEAGWAALEDELLATFAAATFLPLLVFSYCESYQKQSKNQAWEKGNAPSPCSRRNTACSVVFQQFFRYFFVGDYLGVKALLLAQSKA